MNGGAPAGARLRALRHAPLLIDDAGIIPRLAAAARRTPPRPDDGVGDTGDVVRWTRAWLIVWQGVFHERGIIGSVPPWTMPLELSDVPSLKGDPLLRRRSAALSLLEAAGLLLPSIDRSTATLSESAFIPHRAGLEIDWAALCRTVRYEPAPLLTVRALADLVVPPGERTPVTLLELADRTGYAAKQIRLALRRLVDSRFLGVSDSAGMPTRYWFDDVSLSHAVTSYHESDPRELSVQQSFAAMPPLDGRTPPGRPTEAILSSDSSAPRPRHVAVRMTLNGVTFSVAPGLEPHVALGDDGVPHVTFYAPDSTR